MLVGLRQTIGTIGGGQLEYQCIRIAVDYLHGAAQKVTQRSFPLGSNCGQCCGGVVEIEFAPMHAADYERLLHEYDAAVNDFSIAVFGAGHVGSAVVATLSSLTCCIRWVDSRRDVIPVSLPSNVQAIRSANPELEVLAMPAQTYYLIMTHSHALDYALCERILARGDAAYCGLIGSLSKRRSFERRMRRQGMSDALLDDLTCPIGVNGIDGKQPQEIAIAVGAEILQCRSRRAALDAENQAATLHAV